MSNTPRIACQECGEAISIEAKKCPHCSDKKWTKNRYQAYLLLFMPLTAMVAGLVIYPMFESANPEVTILKDTGNRMPNP